MKLLAIWLGKLSLLATRVLHFGSGTTFPGLLAQRIDSRIISKLTKNLRDGAIVVTGTNGKTTTAKMLTEILKEDGFSVLNNQSGSNLTRGIASALVSSSNLFGTNLSADIGVFEVDEATMAEAMTKIRPKIVVVTNLFRDQLDRYGELDKTAEIIGKSLRGFSNMTVLLNADDPLVAKLADYVEGEVKYFGIEDPKLSTRSTAAMDSKDCLVCGHELDFSTRYFGHLGDWECPNCGNKRPKIDYSASDVEITPRNSKFKLKIGEELKVEMPITGLYNVYNALTAAATAKIACCAGPATVHALKHFAAAFGRMEILDIAGKKAMLLLVKNPTGANQALAAVLSDDKPKSILLCLNDNFADGTDISWIWDVDFEIFDLDEHTFFCSGIRAADMALRLKYAGVREKKINIVEDVVEASEELTAQLTSGEMAFVLPTYTAMMEIRSAFTEGKDVLSNLGNVTKHGV
jgi:lipid II isoglutaminyl synthase (glutamine-hydrolysing)